MKWKYHFLITVPQFSLPLSPFLPPFRPSLDLLHNSWHPLITGLWDFTFKSITLTFSHYFRSPLIFPTRPLLYLFEYISLYFQIYLCLWNCLVLYGEIHFFSIFFTQYYVFNILSCCHICLPGIAFNSCMASLCTWWWIPKFPSIPCYMFPYGTMDDFCLWVPIN